MLVPACDGFLFLSSESLTETQCSQLQIKDEEKGSNQMREQSLEPSCPLDCRHWLCEQFYLKYEWKQQGILSFCTFSSGNGISAQMHGVWYIGTDLGNSALYWNQCRFQRWKMQQDWEVKGHKNTLLKFRCAQIKDKTVCEKIVTSCEARYRPIKAPVSYSCVGRFSITCTDWKPMCKHILYKG